MVKIIFDTFLIFLAITFAFVATFFTSFFTINSHTETVFLFAYIALGLLSVLGIKKLGKYYVKNFL